jgi:hypothetical protein
MSRAKTNKLYRTFTKGLITEAGYLTYPEDASTDELNTIISRKGNRTRRPGVDYEDGFVLNDVDLTSEMAINEFVWLSAANNSLYNFLVIQIGGTVHFWAMDSVPVSNNKKPFTVTLTNYKPPTSSDLDIRTHIAQFDAGAGFLFVAHPYVEPLVVEYDPLTDTFTPIKVVVQVRDLEGIYDGLANDEEPTTLSKEHHYNLLNQGWLNPGTIPTPALGAGESSSTGGTGGGTTGGSQTVDDPYTGGTTTYNPGGGGHEGTYYPRPAIP